MLQLKAKINIINNEMNELNEEIDSLESAVSSQSINLKDLSIKTDENAASIAICKVQSLSLAYKYERIRYCVEENLAHVSDTTLSS